MPVTDELITAAAQALEVVVSRPLKQGGQKTVLLVERGSEPLVLKVISVGDSMPDALRRARREVELLQRVSHPNLVRLASEMVEVGDPRIGAAWLEHYLNGDDLADLLDSRWEWSRVRPMALDVARGLGALHAVRVVHRDLSPNNVRRLATGQYVVMDPGFARHEDRSHLTIGGQPGTPGFLSPEHVQAYSGAPTPASDVFCVGLLMFLALTGQQAIPFHGDHGDYLARLARAELVELGPLRPDLHPEVAGIVERCLHPQPARRFKNGALLATALEGVS